MRLSGQPELLTSRKCLVSQRSRSADKLSSRQAFRFGHCENFPVSQIFGSADRLSGRPGVLMNLKCLASQSF
jgi:hypothetical protein